LDNRESALEGGYNNTNNVVPGDSAGSLLIHYVAGLVEDMQMPPRGQGDPLTAEQVGRLRAWIDQGADWGTSNVLTRTDWNLAPMLRWIDVNGDRGRFRELTGVREGFGGGIESFNLDHQLDQDTRIRAEGHALFPDEDYSIQLSWTRRDVGFVRGGVDVWRRYYDDTGGYFEPFPQPAYDLNRDLHLDMGRAWIDFGLTLPQWPQLVLGYEYRFRDGTKSTLEWGWVNGKNIYPATKQIDEHAHIVTLDVTYEAAGWRIEDNARLEFYRNDTRENHITTLSVGPAPDGFVRTDETFRHVQGANTLTLQKELKEWWFASGGYLYSRFSGDSMMNQSALDASGQPAAGNFWSTDQITLRRETHVFSVASMLTPANTLTLSAGLQTRFSRQEMFGDIHLDFGDPTVPLFIEQPGAVRANLDQTQTSQTIGLRYTQIPFTALFADGRFEQDRIGQFEEETGSTPDIFLRDTDYANDRADLRAGFQTSPWRSISLHSHYRRRDSDSDFDHRRDDSLLAGVGYSAFINRRTVGTDSVETRLVLRPARWLRTTLTHEWSDTAFSVTTDSASDPFFGEVSPGGRVMAGRTAGHTYGLRAAFVPTHRLTLSGAVTYGQSRTRTGENVASIVPYDGDLYTIAADGHFQVSDRMRFDVAYWFSRSDYGQDNEADGLPLGQDYTHHRGMAGFTRQLTENLSASVRYVFQQYTESSSGGHNDFTAHGAFATFNYHWH
jgi:hypothetical protein